MKSKKILLFALIIYLLIQSILYVCIYEFKIIPSNIQDYVDYSVIICSFIVSIIIFILKKDKNLLFICLAFIFTLISDYLLVIRRDNYTLAMFFFNFVQLFYALYIAFVYYNNRKQRFIQLLIRASVALISSLIILLIDIEQKLLILLCAIYFPMLVENFIFSLISKKRNLLYSIGLGLFILCDICVGFMNLVDMFEISKTSIIHIIAYADINMSWLFYHPSQVIISISPLLNKEE